MDEQYEQIELEVSDIIIPEKRVRTAAQAKEDQLLEKTELERLALSIKKHGMLVPVGVYENGEGKYHLVHGHRRIAAARINGLRTVPCLILHYKNERDRLVKSLSENEARMQMTPMDIGRALKMQLDEDPNLTTTKLAAEYGHDHPWAVRHLALLDPVVETAARWAQEDLDKTNKGKPQRVGGSAEACITPKLVEQVKAGFSSHQVFQKHGSRVLRKAILEGLSTDEARNLAGEWERSLKLGGENMLKTVEDTPTMRQVRTDTDLKEAFMIQGYKQISAKDKKEAEAGNKIRKAEQEELSKEFGSIVKDDDFWDAWMMVSSCGKWLTRAENREFPFMIKKASKIKNPKQRTMWKKWTAFIIRDLRTLSKRCVELADALQYSMDNIQFED